MTGTADHGSFSEQLILAGKMKMMRYPVHQNYDEYMSLAEKNSFRCTIPYHTKDYDCKRELFV